MDIMAQYPDKYFDLAIVDPPYGIGVNMNAGRKKDTKSKKRAVKKWDNETPKEEYFCELKRVSKNQIIWGANHMIDKIKTNSQGWIFWDKCVAEGCTFSDSELGCGVILKCVPEENPYYMSGDWCVGGRAILSNAKNISIIAASLDEYTKGKDIIKVETVEVVKEVEKEVIKVVELRVNSFDETLIDHLYNWYCKIKNRNSEYV